MIINVTEEDIKNGRPNHSNSCPISLAVRRQLNADFVSTGDYSTSIIWEPKRRFFFFWTERKNKRYMLPGKATKFIRNFDAFNDPTLFKPFSFELGSPE